MASQFNLTNIIIQHLPPKKKNNPAGGYYINCPMCIHMGESRNDTKFRCGITPQPDGGVLIHCYNCHFATMWKFNGRVGKNLMKFLRALGIPSSQIPIHLRLLRVNETAEHTISQPSLDVALEFDEKKLPFKAKSLEYWANQNPVPDMYMEAINYLHGRGGAVFDGWTYYWTNDTKFSMDQRIIIPFFHHGKIVGYTARCFTKNNKISKYFGETPTDYMFNQDKLENDQEKIILVEGVLDAIAIKGVATLGNKLSPRQIALLNNCQKEIILVPDRNKAGEALLEQAIENKWKVSIPDWDRGLDDCANATKRYGRLYTLESIYKSAILNPIKTKIKFGVAKI